MDDNCVLRPSWEWLRGLKGRGFPFPNSYIVFDLETTGLEIGRDLIVQIGYLIVENGEPVADPSAAILNWLKVPADVHAYESEEWLEHRIEQVARHMAEKGETYRFTYESLKEGVDPLYFLQGIRDIFYAWQSNGGYFMAHNGFAYDSIMLSNHFRRFAGNSNFQFDPNRFIDTGLFEKAIGCQRLDKFYLPNRGDNLISFYVEVADKHAKGIRWKLSEICIQKYQLERYGLDIKDAHTADFDCMATHRLYQEFRNLALNEDWDNASRTYARSGARD